MMPIIYFTAVAAILFLALRMTCGACVMGADTATGRARLPLVPLGWALNLFLAVTYLVRPAARVRLADTAWLHRRSGRELSLWLVCRVDLRRALQRHRE